MKKFVISSVAVFAFAFAFVASAAVSASEIYTPASGFLMVGSGMGSKMAQMPNVMAAQKALNACQNSNLVVDGKFGPLTKGVFMAFQASKGIKVDGIIGPVTAAQLAACSGTETSTGSNTGSVTLQGDDADVKSVELRYEDDAEISMRDQKVASFEVELDRNSGDISINRLDLQFSANGAGEERLFRIIEAVTIEVDGKEVASTKTTTRNDWLTLNSGSDVGTVRLSGMNVLAKGDATTTLDILVDVARLSDADLDINIDLDVLGWRYTEATGAISTEVPGTADLDTTFVIEGEESADLRVRSSSNNPRSTLIKGEDDSDLRGVTVNAFTIESRDVDFYVEEVVIEIDAAGSDEEDLVRRAEIYQGNTRLDVRTVTSDTATFDLREYRLRADRSEEFTIKLDLNRIGGDVANNTVFSVDVVEVSGYDANDKNESWTGTVAGEDHTYSLETATVDNFKWSVNNVGTIIDFTFDVEADDEDFTFNVASIASITGNVPGVASTVPTLTRVGGTSTDATVSGTSATVNSGKSASFRVRYAATATSGNNGQFWEVKIESVAGQAVPNNTQTSPSATVNLQ